MYCRYCGKPIPEDSQYCEFCGKQINNNLDGKLSKHVKEDAIERCRICEKIFCDNEPRILLETGEVMCEDCAAAFREEKVESEIILEDEEEFEPIPKEILDVINNKIDYTYEKLKSTLIWLKENEYVDEASDLDMYLRNQENDMYITKDYLTDEQFENRNFVLQKNEGNIADEARMEVDNDNRSNHIVQKQINNIDIKDLKEYMEIVVNMEKNIYLQNSLISQMKNRFDILGQKHVFRKPRTPEKISSDGASAIFILCIILGIPLILIGIKLFHGKAGDPLLGVIMVPFGAIVLLIGFIDCMSNLAESARISRVAENTYVAECEEYEKRIRIDNERMKRELMEKAVLSSELSALKKQNENTRKNLDKIYSLDVIFPKYRNLVMVCSIYEYVCSGRCAVLEGHEGAYNILEMEIRLDRIITQLDLIIKQLDVIRNNQYMLYSAIQETNQQVTQLLQSTKYVMDHLQNFQGQAEELTARIASIEKNSMLFTYQAESAQKELQYMNRMNYLSGKYNNAFFNSPPS